VTLWLLQLLSYFHSGILLNYVKMKELSW